MLDPIPPPPQWLQSSVEPLAAYLSLPTLPYHIHEVLFSFALYQFVQSVVSPYLSAALFPRFYPNFNRRTKLNWDVHVVSLVQSTLINTLALWVMFVDKERNEMPTEERVYGYTGACGLVQAMATGYFVWDLVVCTRYIKLFGVGLWFHAASALWVFSFGFRPFLNYYGPTFILYELSSPFLNFHWFFDKVNMTGSRAQWYNGILLLSVFFCCRLVWGTSQSVVVYIDMFHMLRQWRGPAALQQPHEVAFSVFGQRNGTLCVDEACAAANAEVSKFAQHIGDDLPLWLVITYIGSNLILNSLNFYWFGKMVETVMKRFREPTDTLKEKGQAKNEQEQKENEAKEKEIERIKKDILLDAAAELEEQESSAFISGALAQERAEAVATAMDADTVGMDVRKRMN